MMKKNYEKEIRALLEIMTIEEKVGQLNQCGPSLVGAFEVSFEDLLDMMFDGRISEEEFENIMSNVKQDFHEEDLRAGKIGSYNGIQDVTTANRLQKIAVEETRLGIPLIYGYDVIHGYRTVVPIPLGESCAWEPVLWEKTARMAAQEATAGGVHMTFAPMVDVAKDARWGRISEGAGEDAYLSGVFGAAKVKGYQGDDLSKEDAMVACIKHFAGYGAVEAGKDYNRVDMSMQRFYEEYLPPYKACVDAGARAVMPAFNDLWGIPCSVNKWLLHSVLRETWGFDGMTVSDANAIAECVSHGVAVDKSDAAAQALEAGLDMDMTSNTYSEHLVSLIKEKKVSINDLNRAVADVLRVKFELGLFDNPYRTSETKEKISMLTEENRKLAKEAAIKSMVLLKNKNNILPLKRDTKVGIIGELAKNRDEMLGAWSFSGNSEDCVSIIDAFDRKGIEYLYFDSVDEALKCTCDVILAAIGERKSESGEAASRASITLPKEQEEMLDILVKSNKKIVVVLFNGRPLALPQATRDISAILEAWHPGVEAGNAILDILYGVENPSGKLTTTFPHTSGQCPLYYAHINTGRPGGKGKFTSKYLDTPLGPAYPFGYGLSYTEYEYSDLQVVQGDVTLNVSVKIKNIGSRDGDEIVQCYTRDLVAKRVRPVKQLVDFIKVRIPVGHIKMVEFHVPYERLGYYESDMSFVIEDGEFEVFVGGNSETCLLKRVMLNF